MTAPIPEVTISTLVRPQGPSGSQTHMQQVAAFLASAGRASVIVTPYSDDEWIVLPVVRVRRVLRSVSRPAGVWWYRRSHHYFLCRALARRLASGRAGVVYTHCPASANAALKTRRGQRVVMAVHFHESQADDWAQQNELRVGGRVYCAIREFEERLLPRLDGVVYPSSYAREMVERRIPNLADIPSLVVHHPVSIISRPELPSIGELITVGTLEPRKNHGYLLEILAAAAARGHRYSLTVVGKGPDRTELEAKTRRLGIADQVGFTGFHADPRELMSRHRVYCHTAVMENFGIAPLEAMAEGLPVLAAPVGGLREVVRDGLDGAHWPLDDPEKAAEILVNFMSSPAVRETAAARAAVRAQTDFRVEDHLGRLVNFLDEVAARPIRSPGA